MIVVSENTKGISLRKKEYYFLTTLKSQQLSNDDKFSFDVCRKSIGTSNRLQFLAHPGKKIGTIAILPQFNNCNKTKQAQSNYKYFIHKYAGELCIVSL